MPGFSDYDRWKTTPPDFFDDEEEEWCETCQNTGTVECHCGGDICICDYNGEMPCPHCGGW